MEQVKQMIFDIAKGQDVLMHNTSSELGVKTSLYLVFSVFLINAAFQISSFAKGLESVWGHRAIITSFFGAGTALIGGVALLIAALVRTYHVVPIGDLRKYAQDITDYKRQYPDEPGADVEEGILTTIEATVERNLHVNEQKGLWITVGATALLVSVPFVAGAGILAAIAFVLQTTRPS